MAENCLSRRATMLSALALSLTASPLSGCGLMGLQWRYRYRLNIEVEAGGQVHTGSSVTEVMRDKGYTGIGGRVRGQATTVELPNGQTWFALLRGALSGPDWPFTVPHYAFARELGTTAMVDEKVLDKLVGMRGARANLVPNLFPYIVMFEDINNPKTVRRIVSVAGESLVHDVRLRSISIEITDDPVSFTIQSKIPWLKPDVERALDPYVGSTATQRFSQILGFSDFIRD